MEEQITRTRKRKSIQDRLHELSSEDDEPVITRNKFSKIRKKFDEPKTLVDEGKDRWGDDVE